jgi:hypothetical protein
MRGPRLTRKGRPAGGGGEPDDQQHRGQLDLALGGDDASQHDRGLAGRDEPDEGAGLEERQAADQEVGPGAERLGEVGEGLL